MRLAPKPLEIGEEAGFKDTDLFGYKEFGKRLANLVESLEGSSVVAFDGPWGSGKTTFILQWAGLLRKRGAAVIRFDAFENDHQHDAFFSLAGEFFAYADQSANIGDERKKAFVEKAAAVGKTIGLAGIQAGINWASGGLLNPDLAKITEDIRKASLDRIKE